LNAFYSKKKPAEGTENKEGVDKEESANSA